MNTRKCRAYNDSYILLNRYLNCFNLKEKTFGKIKLSIVLLVQFCLSLLFIDFLWWGRGSSSGLQIPNEKMSSALLQFNNIPMTHPTYRPEDPQ